MNSFLIRQVLMLTNNNEQNYTRSNNERGTTNEKLSKYFHNGTITYRVIQKQHDPNLFAFNMIFVENYVFKHFNKQTNTYHEVVVHNYTVLKAFWNLNDCPRTWICF